jgi:hypothetical protein
VQAGQYEKGHVLIYNYQLHNISSLMNKKLFFTVYFIIRFFVSIGMNIIQGQYQKGHVLIHLSHIFPGQITCYCPSQEGK